MDPEALERQGFAALQTGNLANARLLFEQAALGYRKLNQLPRAAAALSNVSQIAKAAGALPDALRAADEALALLGTNGGQAIGPILLSRGGILDALGDAANAMGTWDAAMRFYASVPNMRAVCTAHFAGALLAQGKDGLPHARSAIAAVPATEHALVVGLLGAIADSAGQHGPPFLAQACIVMARNFGGLNSSTVPYLRRLVEIVPLETGRTLCALGFTLVGMVSAEERRAIMSAFAPALNHVARGSNVDVDRLLSQMAAEAAGIMTLERTLAAMVPPYAWLIATPKS